MPSRVPIVRAIRDLTDRVKDWKNSGSVQPGLFSTLDEVVQMAPFERASVEEWNNYLQPGRVIRRGRADFSLRQRELDHTDLIGRLARLEEQQPVRSPYTKEDVLHMLRSERPRFAVENRYPDGSHPPRAASLASNAATIGDERRVGVANTAWGPERMKRLSHQSPASTYSESVTEVPGINWKDPTVGVHMTPDTLSWSRVSTHIWDDVGRVRLVEEIQSDVHRNATRKQTFQATATPDEHLEMDEFGQMTRDLRDELYQLNQTDPDVGQFGVTGNPQAVALRNRLKIIEEDQRALQGRVGARIGQRGYITDTEQVELDEIYNMANSAVAIRSDYTVQQRFHELNNKSPDLPYKDPAEYAALELRKQLINAVEEGDDWLALTRAAHQISRYSDAMDDAERAASVHFYDKVYVGELKRLARLLRTNVEDIDGTIATNTDLRPAVMAEFDLEDVTDMASMVHSVVGDSIGGDADSVTSGTTMFFEFMDELRTAIPDGPHDGEFAELVRTTSKKLRDIETKLEALIPEAGLDMSPANTREWNRTVDRLTHVSDRDYPTGDIQDSLSRLWDIYVDAMPPIMVNVDQLRSFPALKITDDVRKQVEKHGLQLFARGGRVGVIDAALKRLKEYERSNAPQPGMFSVLDELVRDAPFETATADRWESYLSAGRVLRRGPMQFSLKRAELDDAGLIMTLRHAAPESHTKEEVLNRLYINRSEFGLDVGIESGGNSLDFMFPELAEQDLLRGAESRIDIRKASYGPDMDRRLSHQSTDSAYEESVTSLIELDYRDPTVGTHFNKNTLSWSRTSSHDIPGVGRVRLVEEIQSDVHRNATRRQPWENVATSEERLMDKDYGNRIQQLSKELREAEQSFSTMSSETRQARVNYVRGDINKQIRGFQAARQEARDSISARAPRRGYITPDEEDELLGLQSDLLGADSTSAEIAARDARIQALGLKSPDVPFKNPGEYAGLELRKQLLNAVRDGEEYLALTRGQHQITRYEGGMDEADAAASQHFYDQVYLGELKKLARLVRAEVVDINGTGMGSAKDIRPFAMQELEAESPEHMMDMVYEFINDITDINQEDDLGMILGHINQSAIDMRSNMVAQVPDYPEAKAKAFQALVDQIQDKVGEMELSLMEVFDKKFATELMPQWERGMNRVSGGITKEDAARAVASGATSEARPPGDIHADFDMLWDWYTEAMYSADTATGQMNTFPALKITPEVRALVNEHGVSLFARGGRVGLAAAVAERLKILREELGTPEVVGTGRELAPIDTSETFSELATKLENLEGLDDATLTALEENLKALSDKMGNVSRRTFIEGMASTLVPTSPVEALLTAATPKVAGKAHIIEEVQSDVLARSFKWGNISPRYRVRIRSWLDDEIDNLQDTILEDPEFYVQNRKALDSYESAAAITDVDQPFTESEIYAIEDVLDAQIEEGYDLPGLQGEVKRLYGELQASRPLPGGRAALKRLEDHPDWDASLKEEIERLTVEESDEAAEQWEALKYKLGEQGYDTDYFETNPGWDAREAAGTEPFARGGRVGAVGAAIKACGECFQNSYRYMMDHSDDDSLRLVHAWVSGKGDLEGVRFEHGWVERKGKLIPGTESLEPMQADALSRTAIDVGTAERMAKPLEMPAPLFRGIGQVDGAVEYTAEEMMIKAAHKKHYGPWDLEADPRSGKTSDMQGAVEGPEDFARGGRVGTLGRLMYHITFTNRVSQIKEKGISPMLGEGSNWTKGEGGEAYSAGDVYAYDSLTDALRGAARMDWEFNQTMGSGKISVIPFRTASEWDLDDADPMTQANNIGQWWKRNKPVAPENLQEAVVLTPEMVKRLVKLEHGEEVNPEGLGFARGGLVGGSSVAESTDPLDVLRRDMEELDQEIERAIEIDQALLSDHRPLARVYAGFSSQWKTLDEETGEAQWVLPLALVPAGMRQQYAEGHEQGFRPGIIDEYTAMAGEAMGAFGKRTETTDRAMARFDLMQEDIFGDLGLDASEGALEHSAEFLGIMLGQVPVWPARAGALAMKVAAKIPKLPQLLRGVGNAAQRIPAVIRKPGRFLSEAIVPVIEPKVVNYAGGTAIGTAMGVGLLDPALRAERAADDRARFDTFRDQGIPFTDWSEEDQLRSVELDALELEARRSTADQTRRKTEQLDRERISPTAEMMMSTRR